ncbi:MAG: cyclodeaminase/cyclohydrolase family protein [Planctomycetes bacterium]|nr:cyclodeaminase/cyclohydrolase family protein [Planctomycetota bacterium]
MDDSALLAISTSDYLSRLASAAPAPGGGSAAALTGALAAALGQMVSALTIGKPQFADVEPRVRALQTRLERTGAMLRRLVEEDATAYEALSAAFKIAKDDPERKARIAAAAEVAAGVPFQTVALSRELSTDLRELGKIANPQLSPDVEAAQHLADAAMHAAAANARVNLPLLAEERAQRMRAELERLLLR